ncbi:ABC transporter substrate-binding protein [Deinococcus radiophilus]|uniref:ABC transporter substrate-binding protein n=1 Tax=Deinococcus radiophilus TaxID=32062 RepID=UPI001E386F92|nr:ABC transporter substrate-binding protein [Deinococcus radiophilus]UFA49472.1 ABC transporter substrate-binding protein [Deinococcus radiophilus]
MKKSAILLTTLALMLAACNDTTTTDTTTEAGEATTETTETTTETTESTTEGAAEGTTAAGGGSKTGKDTLVIQESADIPTLDPGTTYDTQSGLFVKNMYETLLTYSGTSLTELEGVLATEWEGNEDGTEYRFTLRENVPFHSGNIMTCADAEYTFQRNLVTNTADSGNWFIAESLLGTGANANDDDTITWERIDNAVQCDGETLVFTLPKADPAFLSKLAYYGQAIVDSQHAIEIGEWDGTGDTWKDAVGVDITGSPLAQGPSGTGAYRLVSNDANTISMEAFEDYWGGAPSIKNVVRQLVPEESSRIQAFLSGDADLVEFPSREVVETQVAGQPGVEIYDNITNLGAYGFTMNQQLEGSTNIGSGTWGDGIPTNFFQDENMRKCFVYAFDAPTYIAQVQRGKGEQLNVLLPKSFLGYDDSIEPQQFDLAQAEEFCQAAHDGAAWENGFTLNAAYREGSKSMQTALEILKQNIEAMNPKFKVNLVGKQWSDIIDATNKEAMVYVGWAPDYADPDNFIHTFYHTDGYYAPRGGLSDPELDALIDEARSTIDEDRRVELYSQIAQYTKDKAYFIHIPTGLGINAYHTNLEGYGAEFDNPLFGTYWKDMSKTQ